MYLKGVPVLITSFLIICIHTRVPFTKICTTVSIIDYALFIFTLILFPPPVVAEPLGIFI